MSAVPNRASTFRPIVFRDGLGQRHRIVDATGTEKLECLCLRSDLASVEAFERALRERAGRLAGFRHGYFAHVRTVERLTDPAATLVIVSDPTSGLRLSDLLATAERHGFGLDAAAGWCLVRQLVSAMAMFHQHAPDAAHGAIAPERIIVTPNARLVIAEYVLGGALEHLGYSPERYWKELRVARPHSPGGPQPGRGADVTQIGVVALSLLLGRPLQDDEYPLRLEEGVESAWAKSAGGDGEPMPASLRAWLTRALQLDARDPFASAIQASAELDKVFEESDYILAPQQLDLFLGRCRASVDRPAGQIATGHSTPAASAAAPQPISAAPQPISIVNPAPLSVNVPPTRRMTEIAVATPRQATETVVPTPPSQPAPTASKAETKVAAPQPKDPGATGAAAKEERAAIKAGTHSPRWSPIAVAAVLLVLAGVGGAAARRYFVVRAERGTTGTLAISTNPPGARVVVDGVSSGTTPIDVTVEAGPHVVELSGAGEPRTLSLTMAPGAVVSQHIELPTAGPAFGQLHVRTEPVGASVTVDGVRRGTSPATITELSPGEHSVILQNELGSTKQTVVIEAGTTASIIAQLTTPQGALLSGWISVSAPYDVQIYEDGRLLGSSQSERLMVSTGTHQLELVNEALGYRSTRTVHVTGGRVSPVNVEFPQGKIALNAIPWAEVWIDGEKVGETPIGNLPLSLGSHEIIFRNPDLGEQRQVATVTLTAPTRISVDLRKP